QTVIVSFATLDGTAVAGSNYLATNGMVTFTPGTTNQTIVVTVLGDALSEASETFTVNLSSPTNATIADGQGVGMINNDDAAVTEGDSGITNAVFTVSLSAVSGLPVTVNFATTDGGALAGIDYMETNGVFALLHAFDGTDGSGPTEAQVAGPDGALYGSTPY